MGKRILFSLKNSFAGSHISRCFRRRNPPFKTIIIKKYTFYVYIYTHCWAFLSAMFSDIFCRCCDSSKGLPLPLVLLSHWMKVAIVIDSRFTFQDSDSQHVQIFNLLDHSGLCNALLSRSYCIFAVHTPRTSFTWCQMPPAWAFFCDFKMM